MNENIWCTCRPYGPPHIWEPGEACPPVLPASNRPDCGTEQDVTTFVDRSAGITCDRCNASTGNNAQGHYWSFCKVTGAVRELHFCCPGDCQLEAAS